MRDRFDTDHDGRLDASERAAARSWLQTNRPQRGRRGPGGMPPGRGDGRLADTEPRTGGRVRPADVPAHADRPLFDPDVVRTWFLEFEGDWFAELSAFYRTDVQVPATVIVDGVTYRDVGVGFRGNTSYAMAPGRKKSFDLAFDFVHAGQRVLGVRNLDLLNGHADPSCVREALHGWVATRYLAAPRVALARVVVNGEDFGVYAAVQQFDQDFLRDHFGTRQGDRFKVPPDFGGNGGLRWLGEDLAPYQRAYELKSKPDEFTWQALVDLCAVLERTPPDRLEAILPQHLDIDGTLWFLAVDNALGDDDGYHARASDYLLYRDPKGRFHALPRDNNEILLGARRGPGGPPGTGPRAAPPGGPTGAPAGGPGGRGGPGGAATSPLQQADRADRPLLRRLLEVPAWRARYLANLRELATNALAEEVVTARLAAWRDLLEPLVRVDAHSLHGHAAFAQSFATDDAGRPAPRSLPAIVAQRCRAILDDAALQGAWPSLGEPATAAVTTADGVVFAVAVAAGGTPVARVRLHADRGTFGAFAAYELLDDGRHGDGAAGDGVFGGSLPPVEPGTTWRWWIEAVAADSGHVDCAPPANGSRPFVWTAPAIRR